MWEISLLVIISIVNNIPIRLKNLGSLIRDIFQLVSQTESVLRCLWNNIYNLIYIKNAHTPFVYCGTLSLAANRSKILKKEHLSMSPTYYLLYKYNFNNLFLKL